MSDAGKKSLLLRNVRIVLPDRVVERSALLINAGRVAQFAPGETRGESGSLEYDLAGLTLFPGFIDVHIHGAVGVDTMAADAADLDRVSQFLATRGGNRMVADAGAGANGRLRASDQSHR